MLDRTLICINDTFEGYLSALTLIKEKELTDYTVVKYKGQVKYIDAKLITCHENVYLLDLDFDNQMSKYIDKDKFTIYTQDFLVYNFRRAVIKRTQQPYFLEFGSKESDIKSFYLNHKISENMFILFFTFIMMRDKEFKLYKDVISNKELRDKIADKGKEKFKKIANVIELYNYRDDLITRDKFDDFYFIYLMNIHKKGMFILIDESNLEDKTFSCYTLHNAVKLFGRDYKERGYKKVFKIDKNFLEYVLNFKRI